MPEGFPDKKEVRRLIRRMEDRVRCKSGEEPCTAAVRFAGKPAQPYYIGEEFEKPDGGSANPKRKNRF